PELGGEGDDGLGRPLALASRVASILPSTLPFTLGASPPARAPRLLRSGGGKDPVRRRQPLLRSEKVRERAGALPAVHDQRVLVLGAVRVDAFVVAHRFLGVSDHENGFHCPLPTHGVRVAPARGPTVSSILMPVWSHWRDTNNPVHRGTN